MDKMKKYFIYILIIVAFAFFSEFLITVGLNSMYHDISNSSELPEGVKVFEAKSTKGDGRIKGSITNSEDNPVDAKYLKVDLYSERDVHMGTKYVELDKSKKEIPFDVNFDCENVGYYKVAYTNEEPPKGQIDFLHGEFWDLSRFKEKLDKVDKKDIFWGILITGIILY